LKHNNNKNNNNNKLNLNYFIIYFFKLPT
jgi:hypothetical protein